LDFSGQGTGRRRALIANKQSGPSLSGGDLSFYVSDSSISDDNVEEAVRISENKVLNVNNGIVFDGGSPSTNLNDYEEGTWTPSFEATNSNPTISSSEFINAFYTKIGNVVHLFLTARLTLSSSGSGIPRIGGLPFTSSEFYFGGISLGFTGLMTNIDLKDTAIFGKNAFINFPNASWVSGSKEYFSFSATYTIE